jgi:4-alpha-glucanotransferase
VDEGYEDTGRHWHATSPETRRAIHACMGVPEGSAGPEPHDAVRVVHPGEPAPWPEPGDLHLEGGGVARVAQQLPPDLPWGYHEFRPSRRDARTLVIAAPRECLLPARTWGWAVQLYATRSRQSWGFGDLADLRDLAQWSAGLGAGVILVNPLGTAAPTLPQQASPYYPCSRRFLNPLYLRVEAVPQAAELGPELERLSAVGQALNADRRIDRDAVFRLKQAALERIFARFSADDEFDRFCADRGRPLEQFATYCALAAHFGGDWRVWPAEYRSPGHPAVGRFAREHAGEVRYHQWLQWLADRQLGFAAGVVPLVQDLPIGVDPGGADGWVWQDLLAGDCSVGAPPDAFNPLGQNWMLPPLVPHKLRAAAYEPVVQTLRALLRHAGGLRIDHVMGLFRLYWIPHGLGPAQGAYVRYRAEELLAILALESRRAGAFVVGEDLGTVEPEVRRHLAARRILSFRVLWFEDRPHRYPELAMAAVTTHDLPTIAGLFTGEDLAAQRALGFDAEHEMGRMRERFSRLIQAQRETTVEEAIESAHRLLAEAPSLVLVATLEDALAVPERPNMPGTTDQRPNWSLGLPGGLEALQAAELARRIARRLQRPTTL